MDRDGWIKYMTQFSNVCVASPVNNQIQIFDGHGIHFGDGSLKRMMYKNIQPFDLKSGDSINYQTNYNGPNSELKSLYNVTKSVCMLKYDMSKFSPHHMNYVLVEAWDAFKMSSGNIIRDSFSKKNLLPLTPTDLTTNNQSCDASIQVYYGAKAGEINNISC